MLIKSLLDSESIHYDSDDSSDVSLTIEKLENCIDNFILTHAIQHD